MSAPSGLGQPLGSARYFSPYRLGIDSAVALFTLVQSLATDAPTIVDVGCGRGALVDAEGAGRRLHDLRAPGRTVIGIDPDPAAAENPVIDDFRLIERRSWPLADESVDLVHCDWVLEHVADPERFVSELSRVLRPGGAFVARTVNRHSLLSLVARSVPNSWHAALVDKVQPGRGTMDVFPTVYAMNSQKTLRSLLNPMFDWTVSFHPGLENYATRWQAVARAIAIVEPRLPRRIQMVMLLAARKRLESSIRSMPG